MLTTPKMVRECDVTACLCFLWLHMGRRLGGRPNPKPQRWRRRWKQRTLFHKWDQWSYSNIIMRAFCAQGNMFWHLERMSLCIWQDKGGELYKESKSDGQGLFFSFVFDLYLTKVLRRFRISCNMVEKASDLSRLIQQEKERKMPGTTRKLVWIKCR